MSRYFYISNFTILVSRSDSRIHDKPLWTVEMSDLCRSDHVVWPRAACSDSFKTLSWYSWHFFLKKHFFFLPRIYFGILFSVESTVKGCKLNMNLFTRFNRGTFCKGCKTSCELRYDCFGSLPRRYYRSVLVSVLLGMTTVVSFRSQCFCDILKVTVTLIYSEWRLISLPSVSVIYFFTATLNYDVTKLHRVCWSKQPRFDFKHMFPWRITQTTQFYVDRLWTVFQVNAISLANLSIHLAVKA